MASNPCALSYYDGTATLRLTNIELESSSDAQNVLTVPMQCIVFSNPRSRLQSCTREYKYSPALEMSFFKSQMAVVKSSLGEKYGV